MTSKVWEVMNDLEMVTSKIVSAREIIDTAAEAIQRHDHDKAETLAMAAYEFLGYYLEEFDSKFKLAWQETVVKQKKEDFYISPQYFGSTVSSCDRDDNSPECQKSWNEFWEPNDRIQEVEETINREGYDWTPIPPKGDKVVKWRLPVQQKIEDGIDDYYVQFPDDLLEAANLKEGDKVEWVDQGDGSYLLRKVDSNV